MTPIKKSIKKYWDWRSDSYFTDRSIHIANRWETILKGLLSGTSGKKALDIGTGRGHFALYLAKLGFDVTGVDISDKMIHHAKCHAEEKKLGVNFLVGDAEHLQFDDNTFDVVVSRNLLWTLPSPKKALKEWRRVMKPEANLVVSDGLWMNYTWARLHHLGWRILNGLSNRSGFISARFFCTYAFLQKQLPFYEGIGSCNAGLLLEEASFKNIRFYDISSWNPYVNKQKLTNREPMFFIAYAKR